MRWSGVVAERSLYLDVLLSLPWQYAFGVAIHVLSLLTTELSAKYYSALLKRHQQSNLPSFAFLHSFGFPNYLTILDQFEVGAFSCRVIDTRIWLITNQHWLYRTSFTHRTVVFLTIHFPFKTQGSPTGLPRSAIRARELSRLL